MDNATDKWDPGMLSLKYHKFLYLFNKRIINKPEKKKTYINEDSFVGDIIYSILQYCVPMCQCQMVPVLM